MIYRISKPDKSLKGSIRLTSSKSESNRVLIIRALCSGLFEIEDLAEAEDTRTLLAILESRVKNQSSTSLRVTGTESEGQSSTSLRLTTNEIEEQPSTPLSGTLKNSQLPTSNSELPTSNSELPTSNSELPTQNSKLKTQNSELSTDNSSLLTPNSQLNIGAAGTSMRFLTAFLSITEGTHILTGSERMKQRPIGILVDALRDLGASIEYMENQGFPPLRITGNKIEGGKVEIDGSVSSQFISALLLIAPSLEKGIELHLKGEISSKPYILMTLRVMERFGIDYTWNEKVIRVGQQEYKWNRSEAYRIEADWSAASYYYSMAALADDVDLTIRGLKKNSIQGDSVIASLYEAFGVRTEYLEDGIRLTKGVLTTDPFNYNFDDCPDIAQTVAVTVAALKIPALLEGLQSLKIKETDRINALQNELTRLNVMVEATPASLFINNPLDLSFPLPVISTYEDHRMAMSFAALAMKGEIRISDPHVIGKSYPAFWDDLRALGFIIVEE
jgi:3-phosphoshikimate 1-carboxyvinyltransferase